MPSAADHARDPGMAPERTALAWQRMATGYTTLAALVLGVAARRGEPWLIVPALALLAVALAVYLESRRRSAGGGPDQRALRALAVVTTAVAVLAAVLALLA
jgi:4-hydroxybenzoate polyprenyltransferase